MEIVAPHANVIVPEVLKGNNYKRWSILMQHYLESQDIWDVVQSSQPPVVGNMREWMKRKALALYAIKISCGEEMFDQIKEMNSAKDVWEALAAKHKAPDLGNSEPPQEKRTGPGNPASLQYETLIKAISYGDQSEVEKFIKEHKNLIAKPERIFENGYTALHYAVYKGKEEIVDYLIKSYLSPEELETKDDSESTALSIAARCGVGKSIAQSLVRRNYKLLTIPDKDGKIPVELACSTIQEDMTRYLYSKTPLECLKGDRGFDILRECITRKMFDIAFDLLHHFPDLASRNCISDSTPLILRLAQTQPPFFGGSKLSVWERWIYDSIRVKAYVIKEQRSRVERYKEVIQQCFKSCKETIEGTIQEMIQEIQETNQEKKKDIIWAIQEFSENSFKDKCVILLGQLVLFIIALPVVVLLTSVSLIGLAVVITLSVPLILGNLILGALRMLVSKLSQVLEMHLYKIKLMDEYGRQVICLICQASSKLDAIQFGQSRAVETIYQAIENGIPDIVKEITEASKNKLWRSSDLEDPNARSQIQKIFACAVEHRQEEVAHFLYKSAEEKNILFAVDEDGNNTLHLAAKLPPQYHLGYIHAAALQLENELRWFKAVKEIVPRDYNKNKNIDNETPLEVFVREHKDLLKEAEEWVKKTAESSTVVGALIITIMFAVAFTVPGGNDSSTGFPILLYKTPISFMIFMVSDAISLFAASSSVIMFLGILTSHHADEDYRKSSLLIIGLTSLFLSIATMTIAFCAALFVMLQSGLGVVIPITLLAGIPIACFGWLQFPLLVEILGLTRGSNFFGKKGTSWMSRTTADMVALGLRGLRS